MYRSKRSTICAKTKSGKDYTTDVGHIEDLFVHLERIFSIGGIWPFERTYVRFAIYILYFMLYLVMAYANFCEVFGDLELMVMNLVETMAYTTTFTMVCMIRCSGLLKRIIVVMRQDMMEQKFEDPEEERIYYSYNYTSKIFLYGSIVGMFVTVMLLYFRPLMSFSADDQGIQAGNISFVSVPQKKDQCPLIHCLCLPKFYNRLGQPKSPCGD
ncbi:hypothetical protein EAI_09171 [Harpegnathos saltator]|uniref:Uncharacterized protein n=1 Tax=Harpegnathos saltator TaxID=610380 RepID=E2BFJ7_HARSA|nr:hypothetical protein EAI_09171 [Harpegnathos saltator]